MKDNLVIKRVMADVEGFLFPKEARYLYNIAKNIKRGVIVEIGTYKGLSTIIMALGSKSGNQAKIYSIDPHQEDQTYPVFFENIKRYHVEDVVFPILNKSQDVAKNFEFPIKFLFIDGDHRYDAVKKDFLEFFPKVIDKGIIALHDAIMFTGPKRVAEECLCKSKNFKKLGIVVSTVYGVKGKSDKDHSHFIKCIEKEYNLLGKKEGSDSS